MAAGSGAVTAFILVGPPPADEIDFEWVGRSTDSVQTTYYVRAQAVDATPQIHYPNNTMGHDLSSEYHDYGIELTESAIK
ncbi:hypothetical protein EV182_007163 [Spiromyces aspiralis]|uniref:Uncharacterized protein n=1 Tax=Spiromyces aspiralis TaxID=68401 RepID=A0ACC1HBH6_9FUNG|nr:hypothetical protein EV182_007163 [Spiromyces aspiralis]